MKNAAEANCEGNREIEALRHLRTGIVAHLATFWEATRASDRFLRRTAGFAGFPTTRTDSARKFSIKGRLPELLFIYSGLSYVSAGRGPRFLLWTASSDPPSCCSDHTQKKSCPQHLHVSLFGLRAYRTRRRSENNPECPCASPTRLSHPLRRLVSLFTHLLLGR